jgi:hypothetical protein
MIVSALRNAKPANKVVKGIFAVAVVVVVVARIY